MENIIDFNGQLKVVETGNNSLPVEINIVGWATYLLEKKETIALRDFLNSLDLENKKDCKDGQHSGDTGKCQHPNDKRVNWHDSAILCSECDCIIEQFGEAIDPPHKLA